MQSFKYLSFWTGAWLMALALLWTGAAAADQSFRCRGKIVSVGSFKDQVLNKCGEPDYVEQWEVGHNTAIAEYWDYEKERYRLPRLFFGPLYMERWTYNLGGNQFIRYLLFRNGELIKISTGEKGSD